MMLKRMMNRSTVAARTDLYDASTVVGRACVLHSAILGTSMILYTVQQRHRDVDSALRARRERAKSASPKSAAADEHSVVRCYMLESIPAGTEGPRRASGSLPTRHPSMGCRACARTCARNQQNAPAP